MSQSNLKTAVRYYEALNHRDLKEMEQCLHPDVEFLGPLAEMKGRATVLEAAKGFFLLFKDLRIRAKFENEDQVMVAVEFDCPGPIGLFRAAHLLSFQDSLISQIELYYDARPFEAKRTEAFQTS